MSASGGDPRPGVSVELTSPIKSIEGLPETSVQTSRKDFLFSSAYRSMGDNKKLNFHMFYVRWEYVVLGRIDQSEVGRVPSRGGHYLSKR